MPAVDIDDDEDGDDDEVGYLRANAVDLEVSPGGECSESETELSSKCW